MCGVVGSINQNFDESVLELIAHRGSDDRGIASLSLGENKILLGHQRLSIQDLSQAGHQPMYSSDKQFVMIFNGEVYNHLELRKKLFDIDFVGHSDTETVINYIAKFGMESIRDLNGIFAFTLLDIKAKKLYLVRDRYGVKPLYYSVEDSSILYSSELRVFDKIQSMTIDKDNLATLLKLRYNPAPTTLYKEIKKLRAGHILEYDLEQHKHEIHSFIDPVAIDNSLSFDEALVRYEELFEQAIKRQLLSDVEVGVLLSGGVDSALVAYYAQKYSSKPIKTFTIGFSEDDDSDEREEARETAKILGTEHYEVVISNDEFESVFKECIRIVEEPLGTTSIIPMYYLNRLVADHGLKVVLTGQGADEPLGGYGRYRAEMAYGTLPSFIFNMLKPLSKFIKNEAIYRAINSLGEDDILKRWELIYALFSDKEILRLIGEKDSQSNLLIEYFYDLLNGKDRDRASAMMSNDIRMNLCDDLLLYTDKISMNFSIEARVPLLDNDLVHFIESLPLKYKIEGKEGKYIHKKFAENILPKEIIYRTKKGFKSPTQKWFRGEKGERYKNLLSLDNSQFSHLFDTEEVAKVFDIHMKGERNMEKQLFTLISIYYWIEFYAK